MRKILLFVLFLTPIVSFSQSFLKASINYSWISNKYNGSAGYQLGVHHTFKTKSSIYFGFEALMSLKRSTYTDTIKHQIQLNYLEPGLFIGITKSNLFFQVGNSLAIPTWSHIRTEIYDRTFNFSKVKLSNGLDIVQTVSIGYNLKVKQELFLIEARYSIGYLSSIGKGHNNLIGVMLSYKI